MFISYFTLINLIHFPPMNSELSNWAYSFKQAWYWGGRMKFSIAQGNCTAVRRTLEDKTFVMIAGTESDDKFNI